MSDYSIVEIEEKAQKDFDHLYALRRPAPVAPNLKLSISFESKIMIGALFAIMLASIVVSAAHTIPIFTSTVHFSGFWESAKYAVGIGTLIMIEIAMIALAYFAIKVNPREVSTKEIKMKAYMAIGVAMTIAISANVYGVFQTFYFEDDATIQDTSQPVASSIRNVALTTDETPKSNRVNDAAKLAISVLIGLCAPIQALISGDILGVQLVMEQSKIDRQLDQHKRDLAAWHSAKDQAWQISKSSQIVKAKRELSARLPQNSAVVPLLPQDTELAEISGTNGTASGKGYTKRMDADKIIRAYFAEHPDNIWVSCEKIAPLIGVGKSKVNDIQRELRSGMADQQNNAIPNVAE